MRRLLALFLLSVFCAPAQAETADFAANLRAAHKAEQNFYAAEAREEQGIFAVLDAALAAEKKLLALELHGKLYYPASAYIAEKLTGKYECRTIYADDTIHTREGEAYVAVPCKAGERLTIRSPWAAQDIEQFDFWAGHTGLMHASAYAGVEKLSLDQAFGRASGKAPGEASGQLLYKPKKAANLLFAIVKVKGDKLYRKFVFVIDDAITIKSGKKNS